MEEAAPSRRGSRAPELVSILVPVYNGERWLRESLDSILAQTYRPIEVIVMDDASTDRTPDIVRGYGPAVRHVRNAANLGQFGNVNRGLELVRGDLVAVFHADDVYDPEIVTAEVDALRAHADAGAAFCKDRFIDAAGREYGRLELPPELRGGGPFAYRDVLIGLMEHKNRFLRTPGTLVRRRVYEEVGGYRTDLGAAGDGDMWLRISRRFPIVILDRHLYSYRHTSGSEGASYQRLRLAPDIFFSILEGYLNEPDTPEVPAAAWRAFRAHRANDQVLTAARAYAAGEREGFERLLASVRMSDLLGSPRIRRVRMTVLLTALRLLRPLPRIDGVGRLIRARWGAPS